MPPKPTAETYDGPVVFHSDGVHYVADDEGHPDLERPLRWVEGTTYRPAEEGDALHNDVHQQQDVELPVGEEG